MNPAYGLGALYRPGLPPGVYERLAPRPEPPAEVRSDVAAFVGLTERGPVGTPLEVGSWNEFVRYFGRVGGGRQTPRAVRQFFANDGRKAVIIRAVCGGDTSDGTPDVPTARWQVPLLRVQPVPPLSELEDEPATLQLLARDPGAWGNDLRVRTELITQRLDGRLGRSVDGRLVLLRGRAPAVGATLRVAWRPPVGAPREQWHVVSALGVAAEGVALELSPALHADIPLSGDPDPERQRALAGVLQGIREVRVSLTITVHGEREEWPAAALDPAHPDYLGRLLDTGDGQQRAPSRFVRCRSDQAGTTWRLRGLDEVDPPLSLREGRLAHETIEEDRLGGVVVERTTVVDRSVFLEAPAMRPRPGAGTPAGLGRFARGEWDWLVETTPVDAMVAWDGLHETEPVSLVCFPDMLHPSVPTGPQAPDMPLVPDPSTRFGSCDELPVDLLLPPEDPYPLLTLQGSSLEDLTDAWRAVIDACEAHPGWIAMVDAPPGVDPGELARWRRDLASDSAAACAPWLEVTPGDGLLSPLIPLPAVGAVCGIVARRERSRGVGVAPANEAVRDAVRIHRTGIPLDPAFLHEERINAIRDTELGLMLLGSRTTSLEAEWTHLSVRRLVHWLRRQLELDTRWAVFEPNNHALWTRITLTVEQRLRAVFRAGWLSGATEDQSFFVRCDESTNPEQQLDGGQVVTLVGVAPAVPAEFIVFRLVLDTGGEQRVEVGGA